MFLWKKLSATTLSIIIPSTHKGIFKKLLSLGRTSKDALVKTTTFQASDHTLVPTQVSINSLNADNVNTTVLVVTDLTEHMDEEVKRYTRELELTQIALTESKERWATTLSCIGDAVIATDMSSKVTFMNAVAEEVTGWTLSGALRQPVNRIFHIINEQTRIEVENPVDKVLKKGVIVGLANHTILVRKDGVEVPIDDSGAPIKGRDGKIVGVVLVFRDITERWKAEEAIKRSEVRFRSLFESSFDGVLIAQSDGSIISANPAACRIFGMSEEELKNVGREGILVMDKRYGGYC